jgi:hypothetical protein
MAKKTGRVSHGVAVSTLFSAMSLLYGAAAYGSFYPGHIDPGGTGTIPGFNGNVVFSIDPNCIKGTGIQYTDASNSCNPCGAASVYSADISLYSTSPSDPPTPGMVLDSFTVGTNDSHGLPLSTFDIFEVRSLNGALDGVLTGFMGPVNGSLFYSADMFWLWFNFPVGTDPAFISENTEQNKSNPGTVIFGGPCTDPNNCTVPTVPEPGTLGLILTALGGGWLTRRRKVRTAVST